MCCTQLDIFPYLGIMKSKDAWIMTMVCMFAHAITIVGSVSNLMWELGGDVAMYSAVKKIVNKHVLKS